MMPHLVASCTSADFVRSRLCDLRFYTKVRMYESYLFTDQYWFARFLFYRGLFLTYFIAFLVSWRQFPPLCGEEGILPFTRIIDKRSFWESPSLFHYWPSDGAVRIVCLVGMVVSAAGFFGLEWLGPYVVGGALFVLWGLYLSLVNVGGLFYGYGWESLLCETGALSIFLGGAHQPVSIVVLFLFGWLLFRVMFGAGMIKIRGDQCWRDLTCMDHHYETQPMPNPMSWFTHHLPGWWHKLEVLGNHFTELLVPFLYFLPQPVSGIGGVCTITFMGWLMITGNFSWLNFLTGVLALLLLPDSFFTMVGLDVPVSSLIGVSLPMQVLILLFALLVLTLSYYPAKNLISSNQLMNAGFDPFNLVNTYGAFGTITRTRFELVVEGRDEEGNWREYEFKGKPTDPERRPPQWAPYHLRLDWQLWFAAMPQRRSYWLQGLVEKLEENDPSFMCLLHNNPFEGTDGPETVRIRRFVYEFTDVEEWNETGRWWNRTFYQNVITPQDNLNMRSF